MASSFYVDRPSLLHGLHPVTRIALTGLGFVSTMIVEHPAWMGGLLAFYLLATFRSGSLRGLRRVWWLLLLIGVVSFAIWSLTYGGTGVIFKVGPLSVTRQGALYGAGMGLRLIAMVYLGLAFLTVTTVEELTYGLARMGLPFPLAFALSLSFRLVPLFSETVRTIVEAQRARGLDPDAGGPLARARAYAPLLAPVFAGALRRTDQLATALESKGFGRGGKRGSHREFKVGAADVMVLVLMALILGGLVWARMVGLGLAP